jgi:hypothetical protein
MRSRLGLILTIAVAIVVLGAVAIVRPEAIAFAALSLALVVSAWHAPKAFVGAGLVVIVLGTALRPEWFGESITLLDESVAAIALIVLTARRIASRRLPVVPTWFIWFGGFVAAGLLSSLVANVPTSLTFQAGFLAVKGLVLALSVVQIDWRSADLRPFALGGAVVVVVIFVASLINLVAPTFWVSGVLGQDTDYGTQFGLPVLVGPFEHPAALGRICALLALAALSYRIFVGGGWRSTTILALAAFPAIFAFRAKTLVSLGIGALITAIFGARRISRPVLIVGGGLLAVAAIPVGIIAVADFQSYFLTESARSAMTLGAVDVAARSFPLGAGFGRYGSYLAGVQYSPEYVRLGFENVFGLTPAPNLGAYLNDTQWPAILGEAGWIGALFFAAGLIHLGASLFRAPRSLDSLSRWLRVTALVWLVVVVVESIAAPVFTSAPAYPLPFVAGAIYWSISKARDERYALD